MKAGTENNSSKVKGPKVSTPKEIEQKLALAGVKDDELSATIDDLAKFASAINLAKLKGTPSLNVTQEIFDYLAGGKPTDYIQYHGIRVYLDGTKEQNERLERFSLDALAKIKADKYRAENPDKCL